jgi:hypothetical protein
MFQLMEFLDVGECMAWSRGCAVVSVSLHKVRICCVLHQPHCKSQDYYAYSAYISYESRYQVKTEN